MSKDPAILFYTSDFLTGTMLMTYEQKGKYITLLCLQHQKGVLTEKDMLNICQSYDEDIFNKFTEIDGKYYNKRLSEEMDRRNSHVGYKIASACLGGLISSSNLSKEQVLGLKNKFNIEEFKGLDKKDIKEKVSKWFKHMLKQMVEHTDEQMLKLLETETEVSVYLGNNNTEINKKEINITTIPKREKKRKPKIEVPDFDEFKNYALIKKPNVCLENLKLKYDSWFENGWKNGNDKEIKNWKSTLLNTLPHIKEKNQSNKSFSEQVLGTEKYNQTLSQINSIKNGQQQFELTPELIKEAAKKIE